MQYLVTGAAGFIGSHLVDALLAAGHYVDGVDDLSTGSRANIAKHERYQFTLGGVQALVRHRDERRWDVVFHCAARPRIQPSFECPAGTIGNNVGSTMDVLEVARRNCTGLIYAGSSTCNGDVYANPYALSKHLGEDLCRLYSRVYGVRCAIARFYNVYGPRQVEAGPYATAMGVWEKAYREGNPLPVCGDGQKRRDWTHVADIVEGLIAISAWIGTASRGGVPVFHLGRGESFSVKEVVAMFGGPVETRNDRPGEALATLGDDVFTRKTISWTPTRRLVDYIQAVKASACQTNGGPEWQQDLRLTSAL